ncbi:monocarboxylate transporter 5 [Plakobranchus ocellatus]|uniref:Monocarboxylate transporter 5 n=1 Tax=Plakobranchus ocellatus TaxID=259542 RepID=A0AAV4ALJ3_9GAST|nr:monocarboxylate transporter 5 [Plakobranchus ocellatus]
MSAGDSKPEPENSQPADEAELIPLTSDDVNGDGNHGSSNTNKDTDNGGSTNNKGHIKDNRQAEEIKKYGANTMVMDSAECWVVCIAVSVLYFLLAFFKRMLAICFLEFVDSFGVSITTASLGFTFDLISASISSVVGANLMVPYIGTRLVVMIGAVCNCVFTFGVSMAPNIALFIVFMAAKGVAFGLILTPSISLMSLYFNRRRSLATAVAFCGMGVGNMVAPPLFEVLVGNFGLWGLFLVVAAIEMNGIPAAMLLRPIRLYKHIIKDGVDIKAPAKSEPTVGKDDATKQSPFLTQRDEKNGEDLDKTDKFKEPSNASAEEKITGKLPENKSMSHDNDPSDSKDHVTSDQTVGQSKDNSEFIPKIIEDDSQCPDVSHALSSSLKEENSNVDVTLSETERKSLLAPRTHAASESHGEPYSRYRRKSSAWSLYNTSASDVVMDIEAVRRSRENSFALSHSRLSEADTLRDVTMTEEEASEGCLAKTGAFFRRLFNKELLDLWSMRLFLALTGLGALVQYLVIYLPTILLKQGLTQPEVAVLMTINGSLELVSRIVIGIFSDFHLLTNCQIVIIAHVVIGTVMHFTHFYTSYNALLFLSVMAGALASTQQNLGTLVTIEILGMERLLSAFGFRTMISTLTLATHHPLLGSILESTGSFAPPLHYVGVCLYLAAILLLMAPMVKRYDASKKAAKSDQPKV